MKFGKSQHANIKNEDDLKNEYNNNKNAQRCIEAQFRDKDKSFTAALRNDWELTHLEQSGFSLFIIV